MDPLWPMRGRVRGAIPRVFALARGRARARRAGPANASLVNVIPPSNILLCDEERASAEALGAGLTALGHAVTIVRTYDEAFGVACATDLVALVVAPSLRDGAALMLPRSLGIRRPNLVVLVSRLGDRVAEPVARHLGFDVQLTKLADVRRLDRLIRRSMAAVAQAQAEAEQTPVSEVAVRRPR